MPELSELERAVGLTSWQHYDEMPAGKLANAADYRAEIYAALPRRKLKGQQWDDVRKSQALARSARDH